MPSSNHRLLFSLLLLGPFPPCTTISQIYHQDTNQRERKMTPFPISVACQAESPKRKKEKNQDVTTRIIVTCILFLTRDELPAYVFYHEAWKASPLPPLPNRSVTSPITRTAHHHPSHQNRNPPGNLTCSASVHTKKHMSQFLNTNHLFQQKERNIRSKYGLT